MSAPIENKNAEGHKATSLFNRRKASSLRNKVVDIAFEILNRPRVEMSNQDFELWKETYLKVLPCAIPKLREITGDEGNPIEFALSANDKAKLEAILEGKPIPINSD